MSTIDLEQYINQYTGGTKVLRLLHIFENVPQLSVEAARLALAELKKGSNTVMYRDFCAKLQAKAMSSPPDETWATMVDERAAKQLERLDSELSSAKQNLIKESIRLDLNELGNFYYERGDLPTAIKNFSKTRDCCTSAKHILEMCLNVTRVAIELGSWNVVQQYVNKAEQNVEAAKDKKEVAKLKVAAGLAALADGKFLAAARKFIETNPELGNGYNEVVSANDIAVYGGLCALASFDRSALKSKVIDNVGFKAFLELVPEVRELIKDFYDSKYATCLSALDKLKDNLLIDIHLRQHVEHIYNTIRQRALKQYVSPFLSVDLNKMASAFNTTVPALEKELATLIQGGVQARIDSHNKILYARRDNQRVLTFEKVIASGRDFVKETEANVRRLNMLKTDFSVRAPQRPHSGMGPMGAMAMMGPGLLGSMGTSAVSGR
eukprot:TRINITY_DN71_c0_g1_i1.p1 TRINITY_DN71_c0_g1~~TRINITY_DN71_c0_g1_i1.p1  ORF type:complete len:437 (+),score=42.18 TRINITY_DN71_c0_g1_i1:46-1356(+)